MDIPLPQEVPVALIPTPPKPAAVDHSIVLPRAKITLKPSLSLRLQPLPPRPSIPLPPLASGPLYCNIPMPDEQPSPTVPGEDPNRYSPSTVLSDEEPTVTSNTNSTAVQSNRFLVLGKAQAKKRLLAFSSTKQAGGAGLTFNLPKKIQTVKQNLAKGFDPTTEGEPASTTVPVTKKKSLLKKVVKEDRARAVITAIEEIKREELLMRGVLRIRVDPSCLGDMTAPVPLIGQPIIIDHDQVDILRKKERDDDAGESGRDRKSDDRRKEKRVRHKSDHRSRDKERERQSKPKEKADQPRPTSPLPTPQVPALPVSWKEFRSSGMSFDQIRRSKIELESKKVSLHYRKSKEDKQKQDLDLEDGIYNPFDYPSRYMEPFKAEGARQRSTQFTRDMIRYTQCKPVISYCLNPNVPASRYRTRAEVMQHAKPASVAIMESLLKSQEDVVEVEESFEEQNASRSWFVSADKFMPPVIYEEVPVKSSGVDSLPSSQTTAGDSGMYDGPVSADSQDDKMSSHVSTSDAFVSSGVVLSKWDSDYEEGEMVKEFEDKQCTPEDSLMEIDNDSVVKEPDCADSDIISASDVCKADHTVKEEKDKPSPRVGKVLPEEKSGSDVMSPDQSGLHTRATSSGADSDPNLQNEYEEFMKSVTAGDEGDEVVDMADEARTDCKTGTMAGNKSESDGRSESNAEQSPPKSAKKKTGPGYKPRKIRSKESRTVKDKRKRKLKEKKKKKRRRSTSTSSSSSEDSSDEDEEVEEEHSKKAKKRKRKVRASKKKKYHKKTKKRRRKSTSSDEESSSSESSTSSSSTSSEDSSSSSDHKKQAKKRKKPVKSKDKKSGQKIKKKKTSGSKSKENVDEIEESPKPLKTVKEKKKRSKVKVNHSTSEIKDEQSVSSNVEGLTELDLVKAKEEPQNSIPIEKNNDKNSAKHVKKRSKKRDSLESDDEEEARSRKSGKKRRKYSKSVSPVERKHRRSPSSSPDRNAASKRIRSSDGHNNDEHKSCENGNSQTGSMDGGKKSGKGERKHKAVDEESDDVYVDEQDVTCVGLAESIGATEVDLPEPSAGDKAVPPQLDQEEVDKLKNAAADGWENDSQLEESIVNSSEGNEWERESPIVEKLPGRSKEVSSNWYEPGKDLASPANVEVDTVENALHPPSLSDDLDQEVAKRSLRELKYLREVIKFEVGNEPSKQDSQSDGETEKDVAIFRRLNDSPASAVCNNDKVTSFVQDIFKEPFLLASVPLPDDTPQESLPASELYSPGQEEDTKSTRSNSPEILTLEPDAVSPPPMVADDSDMSLGSTCSNQDIDVPIQRELLANQWNDFESRTTNFCFPLDNIPLPPSASDLASSSRIEESSTPIYSGVPDADTDSNKLLKDQTMLEEIAVSQANSKKLSKEITEAPVTKAKHVITVKLLPTAERLQSKAISVDLKTVSRKDDTQTGWVPVVDPSPVTASTPSIVKAKRPSRWSDGPVVAPVEAVVSVQETVFKQDPELTTSCGIDIFADPPNVPVSAAQNTDVNVVERSSLYTIPESVKIEEAVLTEQPVYRETEMTNLKEDDLSQRFCVGDKEVAPVIPGYQEEESEDRGAVLGGGEELNRTTGCEQDAVRRSDGSDGAGSLRTEGGRGSERRDRDDSRKRDSRDRERDARKRDVNGSRSRDSRDRRDDRRRGQTDRSRSSAKDGEVKGAQEGRPGSPRRKSSEGTERRRSPSRDEKNPNKDERNKSPTREARTRSPTRDARRRSPTRDNRHRSPVRDGKVRSPNRDARNRSPNRDGRNRSPNRDARNRSPNRDGRNSSPNRDARNRSPNRDGRNRSPNRDGRNRSPSRDGRNRSPNRDGRNRSPGRDGRNRSPGRDGRNRSPSRDGRNRSPSRDGRNRSPSRDSRRRDARKRSPNRDSRDDSRRGDGKSASRGRPRGGSPPPPLSSIPLPDLQPGGPGRGDDCNSMDMEFSSPVSNMSPLVGLKRSLADSTTISDEDLKLAHAGHPADGYGSINPDYYATVKVESNHHSGMHNDSPNYESELSPKRLSLDERLELELGLRLSPKHEPQPPSVTGLPAREAQYHQQQQQHWPYQGSYASQADQAQLQPHQLQQHQLQPHQVQPHYTAPNPDAYASQQASQFAPAPNAYFGQLPPASAGAENKYVPEQHSALRPVPMHPRHVAALPEPYSALRPVPLETSFPVPSIPPDPLPVPRPVTAPVSPGARHHGPPAPITVLSPLGYVQSASTAAAQLDLQTHQFYPKVNVCSDLTKEPVLQLVYTGQLKEAVIEPTLPLPARVKTQSPECALVDKKALQKKAAREKLRKEKEEKRRLVENARLLKMERFAKYKEAIQEEGDTLRRSITLNLEEIRLNLGSQSVSRASSSRTKPRTSPAVKVVPLPEATKGILISIGFREKPVCGPEAPRKSVMFADGVRPGDGSSPSAGEDLPSPVHFVPKKKLHKKKKKIKVHVIRQVLFEESDEEVDLPPPPPPGSPPSHLKPFAFPGPDQGRMYPQPPNGFALAGREVRANELPAGEWVPEPAECSSYPDLKTMKLLAYHQAMMTIKQHVAVWQAGLSPLSRGKPLTPPQPPAPTPAPAPAYDLPNGFPPPQMGFGGAAKTMYAHERIPVVSCSPGPAYCHLLPPPPLPQSPQLRNPPPPPPPTRNKGYRWPP